MSVPSPVSDARAVVTGASSGIGEQLARGLAQRGHSLLLVARRMDRLVQLAIELGNTYAVEVDVRRCDLADRSERALLCEELMARSVSVLCCNAGFASCGYVCEGDPSREADQLEVNAVALHQLTLAVLPGMVSRAAGGILLTGSSAGEQPIPTAATYAAAKAFTNAFAEALHVELRNTGVTCTLLEPGPVRTEWASVAGLAAGGARRWFEWTPAERVAAQALAGLERGDRRVIPGRLAKAQAFAGRHLPRGLLFPFLQGVMLPLVRSAGLRGA